MLNMKSLSDVLNSYGQYKGIFAIDKITERQTNKLDVPNSISEA